MLRKARDLENFELCATDGRIGRLVDSFFDDRRWTVRYFVVDTGTWLDHREVLISPASVHAPDWKDRILPSDLTREDVRRSPPVDPQEPVSREREIALIQYYNWPMYWSGTGFPDGLLYAVPPFIPTGGAAHLRSAAATLDVQHHIRSVEDIRGHRIEARDGEIGHVEDVLLDDDDWTLCFFVVDTRNWWPGRRVLVSPDDVYDIGWDEAKVHVDLTREAVRQSPEYDPAARLPEDYTDRLRAHYRERRNAEP